VPQRETELQRLGGMLRAEANRRAIDVHNHAGFVNIIGRRSIELVCCMIENNVNIKIPTKPVDGLKRDCQAHIPLKEANNRLTPFGPDEYFVRALSPLVRTCHLEEAK